MRRRCQTGEAEESPERDSNSWPLPYHSRALGDGDSAKSWPLPGISCCWSTRLSRPKTRRICRNMQRLIWLPATRGIRVAETRFAYGACCWRTASFQSATVCGDS